MNLPDIIFIVFSGVFALIAYAALRREKKAQLAYNELLSQHTNITGATNHISHAIAIVTPEKQIGFLNPSMKNLLSLSDSNIDMKTFMEKFPNPFSLSENIDNAVTLHRSSDEKDIHLGDQIVHLNIRPLKQLNGQLTGVVLIH
jgi:nitrogen-specific signal transduction histidine kinase